MRSSILILLAAIGLALFFSGCTSYPRYGHRYPGQYPDYPDHYSTDQVRDLADDLEDATSRVEDEAKDSSRNDSDSGEHALERLDDLDEEAENFHSEVNDHRDLRSTDDDFQDLLRAYREARDAIRYLRADDDDVYQDFDRVSQIMAELSRVYGYGGYPDPYGHYPGRR